MLCEPQELPRSGALETPHSALELERQARLVRKSLSKQLHALYSPRRTPAPGPPIPRGLHPGTPGTHLPQGGRVLAPAGPDPPPRVQVGYTLFGHFSGSQTLSK